MKENSQIKNQYLIHRDGGYFPCNYRHDTQESAQKEVERLINETGASFTIFKSFMQIEPESFYDKVDKLLTEMNKCCCANRALKEVIGQFAQGTRKNSTFLKLIKQEEK